MKSNTKTLGWIALICILISAIIFYYQSIKIPKVQKEVKQQVDINAMPKKRVAVVSKNGPITKYTQINDEIIKEKIVMEEIPSDYTVPGVVIDTDLIKKKVAKEDLRPGEQITEESLSTEQKWYGDYDRLKEYNIRTMVAGEAQQGNIVDILVNYGNGSYDVVVPKTKIRKLIKDVDKDKGTETYTTIIAVNEEMYRDLQLASKLGALETRLYVEENQKASTKTFNYGEMSKHIKDINISENKQQFEPVKTAPVQTQAQPQTQTQPQQQAQPQGGVKLGN